MPTNVKQADGTYTAYAPGYAPAPSAPTPIPVAGLNSAETPAQLPPQPEQPDYLSTITAIPGLDQVIDAPAPTQTENKQQALSQRLEASYQRLAGKPSAQAQAEKAAGLPGFQSQLTDINGQIQALQKEAMAIPLQAQQDAQARGITAAGLAPIQQGRLRENAIKSLGLSAIAQTLQGNIALAQQQAQKAVDAEFGGVQAEIDYLSKALELNTINLNREDKERAQNLSIRLQERQRLLDEAKEDKEIIFGFAAQAAKNGAPSVLINQALALKNPTQALGLLATYFQDPNEKAAALQDLRLKRAQEAQIYANINNINADTANKQNPANAKPPTEAQSKQANYASRLQQANTIIQQLTPTLSSLGTSQFYAQSKLPSMLQSAEMQSYEQAKRNFVNAVLRQESGATIIPEEFSNAEKQYFPQPGDAPEVIAQKAANRDLVIRNFVSAAGPAYEPVPGATTIMTGPDGKKYNVPADKVDIFKQNGYK